MLDNESETFSGEIRAFSTRVEETGISSYIKHHTQKPSINGVKIHL